MESSIPVNTSIVMVLVFVVITFMFAIVIMSFVNPKFREKVTKFLPFSGTNEGERKSPPLAVIILIIVAAMVVAYFF